MADHRRSSCRWRAGSARLFQTWVAKLILVPVSLLHGVGDVAAIGRNLGATDRFHAQRLIDGGRLRRQSKGTREEEGDCSKHASNYPKSGGWSHSNPACSAPASSWSGDSYHPNGGSAEQLKLEVSQGFGAAASVEPPDLGL
jgi:hypothetical protein